MSSPNFANGRYPDIYQFHSPFPMLIMYYPSGFWSHSWWPKELSGCSASCRLHEPWYFITKSLCHLSGRSGIGHRVPHTNNSKVMTLAPTYINTNLLNHLSIHQLTHPFLPLFTHQYTNLAIHHSPTNPCIHLSTYLPTIHLLIHPPIHLLTYPPTHPFIHSSIHPPTHLSIHLIIHSPTTPSFHLLTHSLIHTPIYILTYSTFQPSICPLINPIHSVHLPVNPSIHPAGQYTLNEYLLDILVFINLPIKHLLAAIINLFIQTANMYTKLNNSFIYSAIRTY